MWNKGKAVYLLLLVALVMLGASCGDAPTTAETTNRAEQTIETTPTSLASPLDNSEEPADTTTGSNQVGSTSTTVVASTTATPDRELSQAWIDSQVALAKVGSDDFADRTYYTDYLSINPNDVSTPMGALCWAYHELARSQYMDSTRSMLDYYMVPFLMENYDGITDEQIGAPGPEATGKFFELVLSNLGSVGPIDDENDVITEANTIGFFNDLHEFAGDGTAWPDAVRIIASPEMVAAFAAGEGLPAEVQVYADALVAFAEEHVGKPLDDSAESDVLDFAGIDFPGIDAFIEEAKYNQNCKRAMIADMTGNP